MSQKLFRLFLRNLCVSAFAENCSLQKKHQIKESQRAFKACAPGVEYGKHTAVCLCKRVCLCEFLAL